MLISKITIVSMHIHECVVCVCMCVCIIHIIPPFYNAFPGFLLIYPLDFYFLSGRPKVPPPLEVFF